jgi:hypothetical protein
MNFPADHRGWLGLRFGNDEAIRTADVIIVIDCGKLRNANFDSKFC